MNKIIIKCQKCGKKLEGINKSFSEAIRDEGWTENNGNAVCPSCKGVKSVKDKIQEDGKKDFKKRY